MKRLGVITAAAAFSLLSATLAVVAPNVASAAEAIGPSYWSRWSNGPSSSPDAFPVGVFLQRPDAREDDGRTRAEHYRALGVNYFVGLWDWPPDSGQIAGLTGTGLGALAGGYKGDVRAARDALAVPGASTAMKGFFLFDEPDLVQPDGSCIAASTLNAWAGNLRSVDPTRPVYVNYGANIANPDYVFGCAGSDSALMAEYLKACDICSFDWYGLQYGQGIWEYGRSVDTMRSRLNDAKPVWAFIETERIGNAYAPPPTPQQLKSMVWISLIHGARGIEYFAHKQEPYWDEAGLLHNPAIAGAVGEVNAQVARLARVLNSPTISGGIAVRSSAGANVPIDTMVKSVNGTTYVFAEASGTPTNNSGGMTTGTFTLGSGNGTVTVVDEGRTIPMSNGTWSDSFGAYGYHIYAINGPSPGPTTSTPSSSTTVARPSSTTTVTVRPTTSTTLVRPSTTTTMVRPTTTVPTTGPFAYRVSAGSDTPFEAKDGTTFLSDRGFTGGNASGISDTPIAGTTMGGLYQKHRWGMTAYAVPVPSPGKYTVRLHFAEVVLTGAGQRIFDVSAEGSVQLNHLDVFQRQGMATALVEQFDVTVTDGTLDLGFQAVVEDPMVSAIEVLSASPGAVTTTTLRRATSTTKWARTTTSTTRRA